jgi:hypothetical protein
MPYDLLLLVAAALPEGTASTSMVALGLSRLAALCHRSSAPHQIFEHNRYLYI